MERKGKQTHVVEVIYTGRKEREREGKKERQRYNK